MQYSHSSLRKESSCEPCSTFTAFASATMSEIFVMEAPYLIILTFALSCPEKESFASQASTALPSRWAHMWRMHAARRQCHQPSSRSAVLHRIMQQLIMPARNQFRVQCMVVPAFAAQPQDYIDVASSQGRIRARTCSRMLAVLARLQMREIMEPLCVQYTLVKLPNLGAQDSWPQDILDSLPS